jgi:hypothetical protein
MAVPNQLLDGTPQYGTDSITINSVTYIVNKETITPSWASTEDFTAAGLPSRKHWSKGRYKWTGELQLASGSTAFPAPGATFTRTPPNESLAVMFAVTEVPFEADNTPGGIRVVNITAESGTAFTTV